MTNNKLHYIPDRQKSQKILRGFAKKMRYDLTPAEKKLWKVLRYKSLGYEFWRQFNLFNFIPDFYCPDLKFVIEVDGIQHSFGDIKKADLKRDLFLESNGIVVLRVTNGDVFNSFDSVISEIIRIANLIGRPVIAN